MVADLGEGLLVVADLGEGLPNDVPAHVAVVEKLRASPTARELAATDWSRTLWQRADRCVRLRRLLVETAAAAAAVRLLLLLLL